MLGKEAIGKEGKREKERVAEAEGAEKRMDCFILMPLCMQMKGLIIISFY